MIKIKNILKKLGFYKPENICRNCSKALRKVGRFCSTNCHQRYKSLNSNRQKKKNKKYGNSYQCLFCGNPVKIKPRPTRRLCNYCGYES